MVGLQQALLWSLVPAFGLSCSVCVLTFEPGLCVLLLHAASGGVGGALGPLRLALPADGYRGSAGAHPAGRRLGMYKPRACRGPVDGGGHREQPGHPAGQSWAQGKEPVLPSDVFLCCFCERVGAASALWFSHCLVIADSVSQKVKRIASPFSSSLIVSCFWLFFCGGCNLVLM